MVAFVALGAPATKKTLRFGARVTGLDKMSLILEAGVNRTVEKANFFCERSSACQNILSFLRRRLPAKEKWLSFLDRLLPGWKKRLSFKGRKLPPPFLRRPFLWLG
jgi:hypothetical protein